MKNALVISGGGSKGAFAVGAIERLREAGVTWDIVVGASTGALIAPLVVTDESQVLRALYTQVHDKDIVRKRDVFDILTHDSIYDTAPLWQLINDTITPECYAKIVASPVEISLTTVNLQTGAVEYWNQHQRGPLGTGASAGPLSRETFLRAILASASQPVLMSPVRISGADQQYVDGGVREVAPLKVAIDQGAEAIYAIVLSPARPALSEKTYMFVVGTLLRVLDLFV
jgi:predicted acylesterase/phospholipase RssA